MSELKIFREENVKRCEAKNGFNHPIRAWSGNDWTIAFLGEFGEAMNVVKKLNRIRDNIPGNKPEETESYLLKQLAEELADAYTYLDLAAASEGVEPANTVPEKINLHVSIWHFTQALYKADVDDMTLYLFGLAAKYNINLKLSIIEKFEKVSKRIGYPNVFKV